MSDRHRFDYDYGKPGAKCKWCGRVASNPVHRPRLDSMHLPMPRTVESFTTEEMAEALLDVRLGMEGRTEAEQWSQTLYYAERLMKRLREGPTPSSKKVGPEKLRAYIAQGESGGGE